MFKIVETKNTYSNPNNICRVGYIAGGKYSKGDLCLLAKGIGTAKTYINKNVLRQALINSEELLASLNLKVVDLTKEKEIKKTPKETKKTAEKVIKKITPAKPKSPAKPKPKVEPIKKEEAIEVE